jgi:hypothetical protein
MKHWHRDNWQFAVLTFELDRNEQVEAGVPLQVFSHKLREVTWILEFLAIH